MNTPKKLATDFEVQDNGSIWTFVLVSPAAREFVVDTLQLESWQGLGGSAFAVDHRPARALAAQLADDGFVVR